MRKEQSVIAFALPPLTPIMIALRLRIWSVPWDLFTLCHAWFREMYDGP